MEYFPVNVFYRKKKISHEYFAANPLRRIRAVDLSKSEVEQDEDIGIYSVKKLVLDETKLIGVNLAVVDEVQCIAVQPHIVSSVVSSGCIGCVFVEPITIRY